MFFFFGLNEPTVLVLPVSVLVQQLRGKSDVTVTVLKLRP